MGNRQHPFVSSFIRAKISSFDTSGYLRGLSPFESDENPKVKAICALTKASAGLQSAETALALAEDAHQEESDLDLHLVFLFVWMRLLLYRDEDAANLELLARRARSLLSEETPAVIRAWVTVYYLYSRRSINNAMSTLTELDNILSCIPKNSNHYDTLVAVKLMRVYCLGLAGSAAEEPAVNQERVSPIYRARLNQTRFIHAALSGQTETARALLAEVAKTPFSPRQFNISEYFVSRYVLAMIEDGAECNPHPLTEHDLFVPPVKAPPWVESTTSLLKRDPAEALRWARLGAAHDEEQSRMPFSAYCLVRAELASGNGEAARRLLEELFDSGESHYLEDFFYLRVELLAGNSKRASFYLARLGRSIEKYHAQGRLDFEIRLATELSPSALILLQKESAQPEKRQKNKDSRTSATTNGPGPSGTARLIHKSKALKKVTDTIHKFASLEQPVLITGETGTGKELVARSLHEASDRCDKPFIAINCSAISDTLIESELFGHIRGSFSGADRSYRGLFREAEEGTLFLDEIGDISPRLQVALLRVLETKEVRPVGSSQSFLTKCRVVTATNAKLSELVKSGTFRADLQYRLERLEIHIPALRERSDDILVLADHFLHTGRPAGVKATLSQELSSVFTNYPWPGNVRELRNVVERMRLLNSDKLSYGVSDVDTGIEGGMFRIDAVATKTIPNQIVESEQPPPENDFPKKDTQLQVESIPPYSEEERRDSIAIKNLLYQGNSQLRRVDRLRSVFQEHRKLKVNEIMSIFQVSRNTAAKDLKALLAEGTIRKVTPSNSPRTHYYKIKE